MHFLFKLRVGICLLISHAWNKMGMEKIPRTQNHNGRQEKAKICAEEGRNPSIDGVWEQANGFSIIETHDRNALMVDILATVSHSTTELDLEKEVFKRNRNLTRTTVTKLKKDELKIRFKNGNSTCTFVSEGREQDQKIAPFRRSPSALRSLPKDKT